MGLYRQGLGIQEAQLGPEHPHVAMTLESMGIVAKDQVMTLMACLAGSSLSSRLWSSDDSRVSG